MEVTILLSGDIRMYTILEDSDLETTRQYLIEEDKAKRAILCTENLAFFILTLFFNLEIF